MTLPLFHHQHAVWQGAGGVVLQCKAELLQKREGLQEVSRQPARRAGYPHVLSYDVDSLDFTSPGAAAVIRNVTGGIRPGSVVSLHFGYADTADAMPSLLEELARRDLRAVTTTELLTP